MHHVEERGQRLGDLAAPLVGRAATYADIDADGFPPEGDGSVSRLIAAARERGLTLLGFWHGHLEGPAHPGEADAEGLVTAESLGPNARVLVVMGRGAGRAPVVRAFVRGPEGTREIPLAT